MLSTTVFFTFMGQNLCESCAAKAHEAIAAKVMTATNQVVPGYQPVRHIGVEVSEVVLTGGQNLVESLPGSPYLRGARSAALESLVHLASRVALQALQVAAHQRGGNAVVGVSLTHMHMPGAMLAIVATGTVAEYAAVS